AGAAHVRVEVADRARGAVRRGVAGPRDAAAAHADVPAAVVHHAGRIVRAGDAGVSGGVADAAAAAVGRGAAVARDAAAGHAQVIGAVAGDALVVGGAG